MSGERRSKRRKLDKGRDDKEVPSVHYALTDRGRQCYQHYRSVYDNQDVLDGNIPYSVVARSWILHILIEWPKTIETLFGLFFPFCTHPSFAIKEQILLYPQFTEVTYIRHMCSHIAFDCPYLIRKMIRQGLVKAL